MWLDFSTKVENDGWNVYRIVFFKLAPTVMESPQTSAASADL